MTPTFFWQITRLMSLSFLVTGFLVIAMLFIGDQNEGDVIAFIGPRTNSRWTDGRFAVNSYDVRTGHIVSITPPNLYPQVFNWSSDGAMIATIARQFGDITNPSGLYVMRSDGRDVRLISGDFVVIITTERPPFWTDDNRHLIFQAQQAGSNNIQFYRGSLDGTPPELVDINDEDVQNYIQELFPNYQRAPNALYTALVDYRNNQWGLYVVIRGQRQQIYPLTAEEMMPDAPDWSPDSARIAFSKRQNRVPEVMVLSLTGEVLFDIPQGRYPLWKP